MKESINNNVKVLKCPKCDIILDEYLLNDSNPELSPQFTPPNA